MKKQKLTYYEVPKINTIKDMINLAVKEAGNNIAFEYKDKETKKLQYRKLMFRLSIISIVILLVVISVLVIILLDSKGVL